MVQEETKLTGPDLTQGIAFDELPDGGMLVGHSGDANVGKAIPKNLGDIPAVQRSAQAEVGE